MAMKENNEFNVVDNNSADEANVLALIQNIFRHKWSIATLVFLSALLASILASNIAPVYRASNTLLIEQKSNNLLSIEQIYGVDSTSNEYLQTQFELLKSRSLIERVVRDLDLTSHQEFDPRQAKKPTVNWRGWIKSIKEAITPTENELANNQTQRTDDEVFDDVVNNVRGKISINPKLKTQLVSVRVEMNDAATAVKITDALAQAYIESELEAKANMALTATSWMTSQLDDLKNKLHSSEQNLQSFLEQENLVNLNGITTISADELSNTSVRLTDARRAHNEAESMYRQVASIKNSDYMRLASVPAVMSDPIVAQFKAAEATARSKVEELSKRYGKMHPAMIAATTDLSSARDNLRAQVQQVVASIENSYQLARDNDKALQRSYERNKNQIQDIGRNEFLVRELQREVDTNRSLYETFLTRLKETTARQSLETVAARIIDRAVFPKHPIKPQKSIIVALASVVAMLIGVGLALLIEALNNTFTTAAEIEIKTKLPVIGVLPYIKNKQFNIHNAYNDIKEHEYAEAIRSVRTSIILAENKNRHKTILITSTVNNEGKSSLANNLAIALGRLERVLLLDANLRQPSLAENYSLNKENKGLVDYLDGHETLDNCIYGKDGIDIMPTGLVPNDGIELLSSSRFNDALHKLTDKYDRVIIDGGNVNDNLILSRFIDAVVYVIKAESINTTQAQASVNKLLQIGAPMIGAVMSYSGSGVKNFTNRKQKNKNNTKIV